MYSVHFGDHGGHILQNNYQYRYLTMMLHVDDFGLLKVVVDVFCMSIKVYSCVVEYFNTHRVKYVRERIRTVEVRVQRRVGLLNGSKKVCLNRH